jgi:hypothetical protein
MKLVIGNLPPETTAEELASALAEHGIESTVTLNTEGNPDKVTAIVVVPDMDRPTADRLALRISGIHHKGRTLRAFVPLFT